MGKIRNTYRAYTASELKSRADIPAQGNISVGSTSIDCIDINITNVKNVLGVSTTKLSELCTSANINQWSGFSPYSRAITGWGTTGYVTNSLPTSDFNLGDFAGYNHDAPEVGWDGDAPEGTIYYDENGQTGFSCGVKIGELNTDDLVEGIISATMVLWQGANIIHSETVQLNTVTDVVGFDAQISINNPTTLIGGIFLTSTEESATFSLSDVFCRFPNTESFSLSVRDNDELNQYVGASVLDMGANSNFELLDGAGLILLTDYRIYMTIFATMAGYSQGQQFTIGYRIIKNGVNVGSGTITLQHNTTVSNIQVDMSNAAYSGDVIDVELNY